MGAGTDRKICAEVKRFQKAICIYMDLGVSRAGVMDQHGKQGNELMVVWEQLPLEMRTKLN